MSPLFAASRFGENWAWDENIETVTLLVEYGADIDHMVTKNEENMTSTYIAAFAGHTKSALYSLVRCFNPTPWLNYK